MMKSSLKHVLVMAILCGITSIAFAEDAPVFDADNYPPQFDGQPYDDSGSGDVPPPSQSRPGPQVQADTSAPSQSLSLEQRVARAEQQINNMQQGDSSSKVSGLQNQVQALRGQVEELTHQLQQLQSQQRTLASSNKLTVDKSADTDVADNSAPLKSTPDEAILTKPVPKTASKSADAASKAAATKVVAKATEQPNVAEEQQTYQIAYNLIKEKKYNEAVAALQKMLKKYPSGQFAANAHYWLGELYGLMGNNEKSAEEFGAVVKNYADSPKVSDAQLKLGLLYAAAFKWGEAKSAFKKVINRYPGTASARLASEQLKQIKESGH